MKHHGGCHCGQFKFETDLDPMFIIQCNCTNCRRISGSYALHCPYGESEVTLSGETNTYPFKGGSGYESVAHTCKNCHVRVYNKPAPEVMDGIVSIPMGCFDKPDKLEPKVEMWTMEKLSFLNKSDSIVESFEGNAITERLMALLKSMEER